MCIVLLLQFVSIDWNSSLDFTSFDNLQPKKLLMALSCAFSGPKMRWSQLSNLAQNTRFYPATVSVTLWHLVWWQKLHGCINRMCLLFREGYMLVGFPGERVAKLNLINNCVFCFLHLIVVPRSQSHLMRGGHHLKDIQWPLMEEWASTWTWWRCKYWKIHHLQNITDFLLCVFETKSTHLVVRLKWTSFIFNLYMWSVKGFLELQLWVANDELENVAACSQYACLDAPHI